MARKSHDQGIYGKLFSEHSKDAKKLSANDKQLKSKFQLGVSEENNLF